MQTNLLLLTYVVGLILGAFASNVYLWTTCKMAATLNIDKSDPDKDSYIFEVNVPLEELSKYNTIRVKIVENTSPNMK